MLTITKKIHHVLNGMMTNFITTGVILLMLGILIVWTDFVLRLVVGFATIVVAYMFFYGAYKIREIKKEMDKFINF